MMHEMIRIATIVFTLFLASFALSTEEPAAEPIHKELYPSGKVKYESITRPHGGEKILRWFDEDGQLRTGVKLRGLYEETYADGVLKRVRKFRKNGCLEYDANVKEGAIHKTCEYDKYGRPKNGIFTEEYDNENFREYQYLDGKKHGIERVYEARELVGERTWVQGNQTCVRSFYKSGTTRFVNDYRDGKSQLRRYYHADGKLDFERFWRGGVEVFRRYRRDEGFGEHYGDAYISYYKDGSVMIVGRMDSDGNKVGKWTTLRQDGSIAQCVTFNGGEPRSLKRYNTEGDVTYEGEPDKAALDEWSPN